MLGRTDIEQTCIEKTALVFHVAPEKLNMETRFDEDLKARSMQALKLTILLEDAFEIKMPMSRVLKNETLRDCAEMVADTLAESGR